MVVLQKKRAGGSYAIQVSDVSDVLCLFPCQLKLWLRGSHGWLNLRTQNTLEIWRFRSTRHGRVSFTLYKVRTFLAENGCQTCWKYSKDFWREIRRHDEHIWTQFMYCMYINWRFLDSRIAVSQDRSTPDARFPKPWTPLTRQLGVPHNIIT